MYMAVYGNELVIDTAFPSDTPLLFEGSRQELCPVLMAHLQMMAAIDE